MLDPYTFIASSIVADNLIGDTACKAAPTQILHHRRTVANPHRMMNKRRKQFLQRRNRFKHDVRRPLRFIRRPVILRLQRTNYLRQCRATAQRKPVQQLRPVRLELLMQQCLRNCNILYTYKTVAVLDIINTLFLKLPLQPMTTVETNEDIERYPTLNPDMTKAKHRIVKIMIHKDTLAGLHHQLELLAGLVALNLRRNTRLYHTQQTDGAFCNPLVLRNLASQLILINTAACQISHLNTQIFRPRFTTLPHLCRKTIDPIGKILQQNPRITHVCAQPPLTGQPPQCPSKTNPVQTAYCTHDSVSI